MSHKTKTAAALSAETLCKSSVLNIVPYEINLIENYPEWKKMFDISYSYDDRQEGPGSDQGLDHGSLDLD